MKNLTAKQRKFVDGVISGLSFRDACIQAGYSSSMKASTLAHEASKLARHPKIAPLIEEGQKEAKERAIEAATWSCELAIKRLEAINENAFSLLVGTSFISREAISAFFGSLDRLNELTGVNEKETTLQVPIFYFDPDEEADVIDFGKTKIVDDIK